MSREAKTAELRELIAEHLPNVEHDQNVIQSTVLALQQDPRYQTEEARLGTPVAHQWTGYYVKRMLGWHNVRRVRSHRVPFLGTYTQLRP